MQKTAKNLLRQELLLLRKNMNHSLCQEHSKIITNKIKNLPEYQSAYHIGVYFSYNNEVDLQSLWQNESKKKFYAPKVIDKKIELLAFQSTKDLIIGKFKIPEPKFEALTAPKLDILFVPGVAFDKNCNRLGMGGGYYDKLLASKPAKLVIGIAFDWQIVDNIPIDSWDVKVDKVITCNIG